MHNEQANNIANILITSINNQIAKFANNISIDLANDIADIWGSSIINEIADTIVNNRASNFVDFWSKGHKVIKSRLLAMILSSSGARARKQCARCALESLRGVSRIPPSISLRFAEISHNEYKQWKLYGS